MTKRHDAVFDDVLSGLPAETPPRPASKTGAENRFLRRSTALAERAAGTLVEKTLKWVEPGRCRMWDRHNRRYDLLTPENCADLIEGFKAQGGQEFPAIVRPLKDDPDHDYEVICGARRHWTVSWLCANNYPQFRFLIEIRTLTDEEAFRLADIENRDRRDISDYERALDYAAACESYYNGHQSRMAARLEVSEAWLSRYLDLARIPAEIPRAYPGLAALKEFHARRLKPLLAKPDTAGKVLALAGEITAQQAEARAGGKALLTGAQVLARLIAAGKPQAPAPASPRHFLGRSGRLVIKEKVHSNGTAVLTLASEASRADLEAAFTAYLSARFRT